jgi:hypothetical protein
MKVPLARLVKHGGCRGPLGQLLTPKAFGPVTGEKKEESRYYRGRLTLKKEEKEEKEKG